MDGYEFAGQNRIFDESLTGKNRGGGLFQYENYI